MNVDKNTMEGFKSNRSLKLSKMTSGKPEIFVSIQGEGVSAGTPCIFIRLALCNLSCSWCDTKYTWDWKSYEYNDEVMTLDVNEIKSIVDRFNLKHVVITGGEPLLQQESLLPLITLLSKDGYSTEIETNGTITPIPPLFRMINQWNISPKLRNSGNTHDKNNNLKTLSNYCSHSNAYLKFVIVEQQDVAEAMKIADSTGFSNDRVILMPEGTNRMDLMNRSKWINEKCALHGLRFSSRLHILLWQGVRGK